MAYLYNKKTKRYVTNSKGNSNLTTAEIEEFGKIVPEEEKGDFKLSDSRDLHISDAKSEMEANIRNARYAATPNWYKNLSPYSAEEEAQTGESSVISTATLKDAFSLPGRYLATGMDSDLESMKQTSEEREGLGEKILTSPVTGATVLTAPLAIGGGKILGPMLSTSRYAVPLTTSTLEAGTALAAGETMNPDQDNIDRAFAVGLPFLGTLVGQVGRNIAKTRLTKELTEKGIEVTDDVIDKIIDDVGFWGSLKKFGKEGADKEAKALGKQISLIDPQYATGVTKNVESVLTDSFNAGKITNKQFKSAMAKVNEFFDANERINKSVLSGKMSREVAEEQLLKELRLLDDIPDAQRIITVALSQQKNMRKEAIPAVMEAWKIKPSTQDVTMASIPKEYATRKAVAELTESPLKYMEGGASAPYNRYAVYKGLEEGATGYPRVSNIADYGLGTTAAEALKASVANPYMLQGTGRVLRYSPALEQAIREGEE